MAKRTENIEAVIGLIVIVAVICGLVAVLRDCSRETPETPNYARFQVAAQNAVRQQLKYPMNASFPFWEQDFRELRDDESVVTVTGVVEAMNTFGAKIRRRYVCRVDKSGICLSCNIDGKEYLKPPTFTERRTEEMPRKRPETEYHRQIEQARRQKSPPGEGEGQRPARTVSLPGGVTMEMVWIEPGTFMMGSLPNEPGRLDDEGPQHRVTITEGFYLGKYEITQRQWCSVIGTRPWAGKPCVQEGDNYPATYVSWNDLQIFIEKLNQAEKAEVYRLPTEAEWEYACRAGTTTRWSFGDDEDQMGGYAWYLDNAWLESEDYAHAVGLKFPNPWGMYDMHGNLHEWCQDWKGSYSTGAQIDPRGPSSGSVRVMRSGFFMNSARLARSAFRDYESPDARGSNTGARLLRQER